MICDELCAAVLCDYDYSNTSKLRERYAEHYKTLGQLDKQRILRYRVQEGWTPLCNFLAVPVPDIPFPRSNDSRELQELGQQAWWTAVRNSMRNVFGGATVILVAAMAAARLRRL
jgi:Sulfotransferase domain